LLTPAALHAAVSAGNAGTNFAGTIPALCPDAMTVSSLTQSGAPSSFSNFASSSSSKSSSLIAAPGEARKYAESQQDAFAVPYFACKRSIQPVSHHKFLQLRCWGSSLSPCL
jgi:hypothetical protein